MTILDRERQTLEKLLPGFDATLARHSLDELERPDGSAIRLLRNTRGSALLVPLDCQGLGATPNVAVQVQRAIGARAPSLAVATAMHHFSVGTLLQYSLYDEVGKSMLALVASEGWLVASGFAEGRPAGSVLDAHVKAEWTGSAYRLKGSKKPCSLSRSMDLLSAGVVVTRNDALPTRGVVVVPGNAAGLQRKPFWNSPILAATESDELILDGVEVPEDMVLTLQGGGQDIHAIEIGGLCWFTLLISASYLGIASGLVERMLVARKGSDYERVIIVQELEGAMSALEGLAARIAEGTLDRDLLSHAQLVKYAVQDAIERATVRAVEVLGGLNFIRNPDVSYLFAASRALAFHPPARSASVPALASALQSVEQPREATHVAA